jgi:hypothetical protein
VNERQLFALTDPYDGTSTVDKWMAVDDLGGGVLLASALAVDR